MVSTQFRADTPMLYMDIDRPKSIATAFASTTSTRRCKYLGPYYVNNFNEFGRYWQVNIQADGNFRNKVE